MPKLTITFNERLVGLKHRVRCVGGSYHNRVVKISELRPWLEVAVCPEADVDLLTPESSVYEVTAYTIEVYNLEGVRLPTGALFYEYHLKGECEEWLSSGVVDDSYEPPKTAWKLGRYLQANWARIDAARLKP